MAIDYTQVPDLTESQIAALTGLHDADVSKLIINRDDIKQEKLGVQEKLTAAEKVAEDARAAATKSEEERLRVSGTFEEQKAHFEEQLAAATATSNEATKKATDALTSRDRGDSLGKVMDLIHDDHKFMSRDKLSNMLKDGYNDQGQYTPTFEHEGKVVANNIDEFKGWASEQSSFKKILNGVDSSGADTTQSRSSASLADKGDWAKMSIAEKSKYLETKG